MGRDYLEGSASHCQATVVCVFLILCVCVCYCLKFKVCKGQPELPSSPFNSLSVSVPNGLLLQFLREDAQGQ